MPPKVDPRRSDENSIQQLWSCQNHQPRVRRSQFSLDLDQLGVLQQQKLLAFHRYVGLGKASRHSN